jgi:hypothetical protein
VLQDRLLAPQAAGTTRRLPLRVAFTAGLLATLLAHAPNALASGPGAEEAKASADAAFDGRRYAEALELYQTALQRGADARVRYNMGQALSALERYPEALASYQAFLAEAPAGTLTPAQQDRFFALLDELKTRIARLQITCTVPGARVLVRDKVLGTTPLATAVPVNAGRAKVEVIAEGFRPFAQEIDLAGGATRNVTVDLERIDFTGALVVKGNLPDAMVIVDGSYRGSPPLSLRVDQGAHTLVVRRAGYVEQSKEVAMTPGGHTELTFTLRVAPDYTIAYTGLGIAAAGVVGGAITGILAFTTLSDATGQCDTGTKQCGPSGQSGLDTSRTYGTLSTVAFGIGLAGGALGIYGWTRARRSQGPEKPVEVVLMPGGFGLRGAL